MNKKTFGKALAVTSDASPGLYQMEPSGTFDRDGNVVLTFMGCNAPNGPNALVAAKIGTDGGLAGERIITTGVENHFNTWTTTLRDGTVAAVWLGFNGNYGPLDRVKRQSNQQIGFATSKDGLTWSPAVRADTSARDCPNDEPNCIDKPMIVAGPDSTDPGREAIYITLAGGQDQQLRVIRSTDGGKTFKPSVAAGPGIYGDINVSSRGVVRVVAVTSTSETGPVDRLGDVLNAISYRRSDDGGATFTKPVMVSAPETPVPFFFSNAQIVVDEARKFLYVAYPVGTPDGRWDIVLATSRDDGAHWTRIKVNDDAPCANHMIPSAAFDPRTGRVHLLWIENRTGRGGAAYTSCDPGGAKCAPNEAVSDTPFAAYGFVRHSPKWLGQYGSLLIDVKRRTLHALWTQTVQAKEGEAARVFYARGELR
ncbi:MAG TPA: sialidase family protein [Polyangiaceae bacterium]|nr:sialidase family protein [Polyangiaceae bacterium]